MSKTCCTVDLYSGPSVGPKSYSYVLQKVTSHDERVKLTTFEAFSSCEKDDFPLLNRDNDGLCCNSFTSVGLHQFLVNAWHEQNPSLVATVGEGSFLPEHFY